jgi:hypothetical protein
MFTSPFTCKFVADRGTAAVDTIETLVQNLLQSLNDIAENPHETQGSSSLWQSGADRQQAGRKLSIRLLIILLASGQSGAHCSTVALLEVISTPVLWFRPGQTI